jgi:hypothetical protein
VTAADIVADVRAAIQTLTDADSPAATRVGEALSRWLAGESFEDAAGLSRGWRRVAQQTARDTALRALVKLFPTLDDSALAHRIVAGIARAARMRGVRPDGENGLYFALSRLEKSPAWRTWRDAIAEIRGKRNPCVCQGDVTPSATTGEMNGKKADTPRVDR